MKSKVLTAFLSAFVVSAVPAFAHHPFAQEFDWKKPVTVTGIVTKIEWANPHAMVTVEGKDDHGVSGTWTVELGSPGVLQHYGWKQDMLKPGEKIAVDGWQAKNGSKSVNAKSVNMANGHEMFAGSSFFQMGTEPDSSKPAATTGSSSGKR